MSEITLHQMSANPVTCVPDYFIDKYMVEANGEYVKIYLYILRCLGRSTKGFSITKIADDLEHTQKDIRKALRYWERAGLLELTYDDYDELTCIYLKVPEDAESREKEIKIIAPEIAPVVIPQANSQGYIDPANDRLKDIAYVVEKLIGHPPSQECLQSVIIWNEELHLSWDLIEYIIEYSVDKGNMSFKYMDKVALNYAKDGIFTVEQAKIANNAYLSVSFAIKSAFGISGRNLGQTELAYVNKWTKEYGFSSEIINEACNRTLDQIHSPSFKYADSILKNWKESNVTNLDDIALLDDVHKTINAQEPTEKKSATNKSSHNFPERSDIDYKAIEQKLLRS